MRKKLLMLLLITVSFISSIILFSDRIASFYINNFTAYNINYDKWGISPLNRSDIYGLELSIEGRGMTVKVDSVRFDINFRETIKSRSLVFSCELNGLSLEQPDKEVSAMPGSGGLLSSFDPSDIIFDRIDLSAQIGRDKYKVTDFKASSKDIRLVGDCEYLNASEYISIDLKISFSTAFFEPFPDSLFKKALTYDEQGWYSTVINYKGNILLLKAMYSITR